MRGWLGVAALALAAAPAAGPALAQDSACTYDTCGLRLRGGALFRAPALVRGVHDEKVAGLGFLAPRLELFAQRSDSAAYYYEWYRSHHNTGSWLGLAGLVPLAVVGFLSLDRDREATALDVGLALAGFGLSLSGAIVSVRAPERLYRAIWWYNRTLPREPEGAQALRQLRMPR